MLSGRELGTAKGCLNKLRGMNCESLKSRLRGVMYCPQCKVEYRQGFTRCADCDVDLVYELPVPPPRKMQFAREPVRIAREPIAIMEGEELKPLHRWNDSLSCADACLKLKDAGIAFRVTEFPHTTGDFMQPRPEFEIAVPVLQYDGARAILGIQIELGEENLPSEEEIRAVMELPEGNEIPSDERAQSNRHPTNWFPEDATVEVWSGRDLDAGSAKGWMIELALKENRILFRGDDADDGTQHFYVLPADELRAKELVREILEAAPPE
jgi:hypothetical protein